MQYVTWKANYPLISGFIEFFRLNEIYVAPVTVFFLTLFFINLIVVVGYRVPVVLRRAYIIRKDTLNINIESVKTDPNVKEIVIPKGYRENVYNDLRAFFRKRLWFVADAEAGRSFLAVRNRYSPLGFLLFHLSFLLCLIGGLFVMYTRFSGNLVLTEGQGFDADITQFRRITRDAKIFKALPSVGLNLEKVIPKYEKDKAVDLTVLVKVKYWDKVKDETVKINQPVKRGAVTLLAENVGISPLFILKTEGGKEITGGYFSLNVLNGAEDSFEFENMPYRIFVKFYPDYAVKGGKEVTNSKDIRNPFAHLRVEEKGKVLYEGSIGMGQEAVFDSMHLYFEDARYWVNFLFVREYGNLPLFIGFLSGVIGLIMRLVFYQKTLRICVAHEGQESLVYVLGQSEYYKYSFQEEMERLVSDLKAVIGMQVRSEMLEQKGDLKA